MAFQEVPFWVAGKGLLEEGSCRVTRRAAGRSMDLQARDMEIGREKQQEKNQQKPSEINI